MILIFKTALCSAYMVNCSAPDKPALLECLSPVFEVSDICNSTVDGGLPVKPVSSCNLDICTVSFNIQNCNPFNPYLHFARDIKIFLGRPAEIKAIVSKSLMATMCEWELLDITSDKATENDINSDGLCADEFKFHIRLRCRATKYMVNVLFLSCFPHSVDRSAFKMTLILSYTVFPLIMNDLLPGTGNTIPLICVFFSICLPLMVASLRQINPITNLLCGSADFSPVLHWIRVLTQFLGFLVSMAPMNKKSRASEIDLKTTTAVENIEDYEGPQEKNGPAVEDGAVQELKKGGKDLQDIHRQVNQGSEDWMQCCSLKVRPSKLLLIFISLLMHAQYSSTILNCSNPDTPSVLEALSPVFNLNAIRPVVNITTVTNVGLFLTVFGILGVDEKAQLLTTFLWPDIQWENEFTKWDPENCGTTRISIPRTNLWVPDIVINEIMDENTAPNVPYTYVLSNGIVSDSQPVKAVTSCRLDIYLFPFDIQNCTLTFNSFTLKSNALQLYLTETPERMFEYSKSRMETMGEWELIGITAKKYTLPSTASGFYDEIRFHISLRRQAMLYVVNLLLPSCFLITVDLFSFILPPNEVDRSLFKMTLILGYTVFLLIMNDLLPVTGNAIPLINVFLSMCLTMMVGSLLETIVVTSFLHGSSNYSRAPRWIRVLFLKILGRLVCLPPKPRDRNDTVIQNPVTQEMPIYSPVTEESKTLEQKGPLGEDKTLQELRSLGRGLQAIHLQLEKHLSKSLSTEEWIQIGLIIDRLLFILYIIFITVSFITIIIIWVVSYNAA
ncbi:5-hydroxytryptamine receptor 3C-like [Astatotilapia calliptera]|uniref:5-hydroxytryptamine receptor 3C-like n=1 Tax=Astatotilapia calliptera TaxID=8154 RepID=UPI000E3FA9F8|nr:5-hydroxytryptamine receptor 3C-like [Astatotilapia calliptera]